MVNGVHLQGVAAQLHFGDFVRIESFSPGVHLIVKMKVSYQLQFRPSPHLRNQLLHPAPHRKLHAVLRILQRMQFLKNIHKQYMCFGPPTKGDGSRTSMQ